MPSANSPYKTQYNLSYIIRYNTIKPLISTREYSLPVKSLNESIEHECIVIGILFLDSKGKFSILREGYPDKIENERNYCTDTSKLYIEDPHGKIPVVFLEKADRKLTVKCTGIILGFVGSREIDRFVCTDVIFPDPLLPTPRTDLSVLLINGDSKRKIESRMIIDYFSDKISDVIVLGTDKELIESKEVVVNSPRTTLVPILSTQKVLPIEPLHPMHLKQFSSKVECATHNATIQGMEFVFLPTRILKDLRRYLEPEKKNTVTDTELVEFLLKTRVLAPNSPDTVESVPFDGEDPFFLKKCDYLIASGQKETKISDFCGTKIILLSEGVDFVRISKSGCVPGTVE